MKTIREMQEDQVALQGGAVNAKEMLRLELLTSLEKYTKCMFKQQYNRAFIVAEHHKRIIEALQEVVDGKCKRLIINLPPRFGKCCHPDTPILTTNGKKALKDIISGDVVYSWHDNKLITNKVLGTEPAYKESCEIKMRSGKKLIASCDHPMLTTFGYKAIEDLEPGERIYALQSEINGEYEIPDAELILCTALIFNGNITGGNLRFSTTDNLVVDAVNKALQSYGPNYKLVNRPYCKSFEYYIVGSNANHISDVRLMLERNNLYGHKSYDKRLPNNWFALSMRQKYMFVDMMIATDGCITKSGQIAIGLANKGLIQDIQLLLQTMGIISTYVFKANDYANCWTLYVPRQYVQKLYSHLTFYGKKKAAESIFAKNAISLIDTFPYDIIRKERLTGKTASGTMYRCDPHKSISRDKYKKLMPVFPQLAKYYSDDFYLDEIVDIKYVGYQPLIHIEVENDHNFIANGLVSHNTELAIKAFISWCFALNPKCRFMHLSYSDDLVNDNSATIRNTMQLDLYRQLFPESIPATEKGSSKYWKTKAGGEMYAVSTQGQVTGRGAGNVDLTDADLMLMQGADNLEMFDDRTNEMLNMIGARTNIFQGAIVIDDPLKPEDAESEIVRERINMRFENTIRSRVNSRNTPIIIIMQRLHEHDLSGYLQEIEPDEWTVLSMPAIQHNPDTGEERALWPMKYTLEELYKMREVNPVVFDTQYMQDPTPKEGLMYEGFRTYKPEELPAGHAALQKWNYTDTADTGADFLCSICFINTPEFCYVTDVLFTDAPMEVTEPKQAEMLVRNQTTEALIESNNGGRGFARNVKRILRVDMKSYRCAVKTFTQTQNKSTRIFTASAQVQNDILFPEGWEKKWPKFHAALMTYRKDNKKKSQHDDAPDCLTGVYELHARRLGRRKIHRRN